MPEKKLKMMLQEKLPKLLTLVKLLELFSGDPGKQAPFESRPDSPVSWGRSVLGPFSGTPFPVPPGPGCRDPAPALRVADREPG